MTHGADPADGLSAKPLTVYEPQRVLGGVLSVAAKAGMETWRSRYLIWKLFLRDFHAQFRQKIFGYLWAFISPFFAVFGFVVLHAAGILSPGETGVPYPLYVFVGLSVWNVLVSTIGAVSNGLLAQGDLIMKTNIPKIALALAALAQIAYQQVTQLVVIMILLAVFRVAPGWSALLYVPALVPMLVLGIAIGLVTSVIGSIARDLAAMVQTGLSLVMFLTPVIFVASSVANPWIQGLIWLNPLTYLVDLPRALLLYGGSPLWAEYLAVTGLASLLLVVAIKVFYLVEDLVAERL